MFDFFLDYRYIYRIVRYYQLLLFQIKYISVDNLIFQHFSFQFCLENGIFPTFEKYVFHQYIVDRAVDVDLTFWEQWLSLLLTLTWLVSNHGNIVSLDALCPLMVQHSIVPNASDSEFFSEQIRIFPSLKIFHQKFEFFRLIGSPDFLR